MTVISWRIAAARRYETAFTGKGASVYPGRWNREGTPVVYTAATLSLAALEILAHATIEQLATQSFVAIPAAFEDQLIRKIDVAALPEEWSGFQVLQATRDIGTMWAQSGESAVLAVPSAIIPIEFNYLINPRHPDFSRISIGKPETFHFDKRLMR